MNQTTTSTCPRCSGAVLSGDRFCGSCGAPIALSPATSGPRATMAATPVSATAVGAADTSPWTAVAARLQHVTLGEFEIMTELGRGGMAAVYLARDLTLNRRVAIKVMAPGLLHGPGMIERFRQEAVTVANLQHAHIVAIHAVRQFEDLHFFVMQFVPGRTLETVLRDVGALPIPVVRAWLYQVGSALGYAHRRGVIHRDVKPGNILLNSDGDAVVTDFGIAKVAESPSHTQTGTVVGTPVYMSPEQCYARELTGASDQYSLGVVAYEMLAGRPPFSGSSFALMRSHTDEAPPPLTGLRPDIPPQLDAALMRMLAKRPEDRFATLAEALVALGAAPVATEDPLNAELQKLAAVSERLELLADVIRTPASPVPQTRERPRAPSATPHGSPVTQALIVAVAPPPSDLEPGRTATLRAVVRNGVGQPVPGSDLVWSSSNPAVVSVDPRTGTLTALAAGSAVITARVGAAEDSVDVVVGASKVAPVAAPEPRTVVAPRRQAAREKATSPPALAASKSGIWKWVVPVIGAAGVAGYFVVQQSATSGPKSSAPAPVAPVDPSQPKAAVSSVVAGADSVAPDTSAIAGNTTTAATPDSITAPAPIAAIPSRVEIRPPRPDAISPGETVALEAIVRDANGGAIANSAVTWSSSNARVATIDAAQGIVRGLRAGTTRLTASVGSLTSTVTLSVVPAAADASVITSIEIAEFRQLTVGESVRLSATVRNAAGPLANALIDWSSSNPNVASIAPDGMLTARAAGTTIVHASAGGRSADRSVVIRAREVVATPAPAANAVPTRSEADLRSEIEVLLAAYARAIETRDTLLIRRIFPSAGEALMTRWQTTFDDARSNIQMSAGTIELLDTPRDVTGSQVRAQAKYSARFSSRAARKDQSFPVTFTAVLQRDGGTWRIVSIR